MKEGGLRFSFIVEERYRRSRLPMAVVDQLQEWDHECVVLEPHLAAASLGDLLGGQGFDAVVLRTLSNGPGLSLLQALAVRGDITINNGQAVQRVRDKLVAAAIARANGIPFPDTFFLAHAGLVQQVPSRHFPLVVKPSSGGLGQGVHLVHDPDEALSLIPDPTGQQWIAQPRIPNPGYDIKLYNTGCSLHAVRRRSSLLGGSDEDREEIALSAELRVLTLKIGAAYGLDIYGADVVKSANGWVVVDVNDFPSFKGIAEAPELLATSIVGLTRGPRPAGRP